MPARRSRDQAVRPPLRVTTRPLCSCFVRKTERVGKADGSIFRSRQTPAGAKALRAGGRLCAQRGEPPPVAQGRRAAVIDLGAPPNDEVAVDKSAAAVAAPNRTHPAATSPGAGGFRRRLARFRGIAAVQDQGDHRFDPQDHHPQRFARHFVRPLDQSLSRLSAAASIALRGRPTPIWGCRPGSISKSSCSPSRRRRNCSNVNSRPRATFRAPSRSAPTPIPTSQ